MRNLFKFLFILIIISCDVSSQDVNLNILGNWYSFDEPTEDVFGNPFINYHEVYLNKKIMFRCSEDSGVLSPREYLLVNDSLYFQPKSLQNYLGVIDSISKDYFRLRRFDNSMQNFLKISTGFALGDIVSENKYSKEELLENKYFQEFNKRLIKQQIRMRIE